MRSSLVPAKMEPLRDREHQLTLKGLEIEFIWLIIDFVLPNIDSIR